MRRLLWNAGPLVAYAGMIFFVSAQSQLPHVPGAPSDKLAHVAEYAVFGALAARMFRGYALGEGRAFAAAVALGVLYGMTDELHQLFVPNRSSEVLDVVADGAGSVLGAWAYAWGSVRKVRR